MKHKKTKLSIVATAMVAMGVATTPVFATNPYGIEYTGGQELGANNVTINPSLLEGLTPLIDMGKDDVVVEFSDSNLWKDGYSYSENCAKIKYIMVSNSTDLSEMTGVYYTISNRQYTIKFDISSIIKEDLNLGDSKWVAVSVLLDNKVVGKGTPKGSFEAGFRVSEDDQCTNPMESNSALTSSNGKIFVHTKQTLYSKIEPNKPFTSSELFYGIMDIDAAQSFKILNPTNVLKKNNMYAKSATDLQPASGDLRNMYVGNGNYIYAEAGISIAEGSDIFVKLNETAQGDGLDFVYGFIQNAGSPISYYAKQYQVKYESDKNGKIEDVQSENIIAGKTPFGSISTPATNYQINYWTADKNVVLTDGTTIKAGNPITPKQVKQVVVNEDLTFTAIHAPKVAVPDTGIFTKESNGLLITLSVAGMALGTLTIALLAKATRKIHRRSQF
jgi:hypothetical protein